MPLKKIINYYRSFNEKKAVIIEDFSPTSKVCKLGFPKRKLNTQIVLGQINIQKATGDHSFQYKGTVDNSLRHPPPHCLRLTLNDIKDYHKGVELTLKLTSGGFIISLISSEITNSDYHSIELSSECTDKTQILRINFSEFKRKVLKEIILDKSTVTELTFTLDTKKYYYFDFEIHEIRLFY